MALRIRFQYPTGASLGYSVERVADGVFLDFTDGQFRPSPASAIAPLPEDTGIFIGRYKVTLSTTPQSQFTDGDYVITIHDKNAGNLVVSELPCLMYRGDDASLLSAPLEQIPDPWSTVLPGNYAPGTAGAVVGECLDARISSRSTFAGGFVQGVISAVTVSQNQDKTGYSLAPNGLDSVPVEANVNARQAFSPILAAVAGSLSGAGTGSIVIKGAGTNTTRITATTDNAGNRSSISLNLPT